MPMKRKQKKSSTHEPAHDIPTPPLVTISDDEKWRLINHSGVLNNSALNSTGEDDEPMPLGEEIFNSIVFIIPFSFLLLLMEILIHLQYAQEPTRKALMDRMGSGVPILSVFIFYTMRYKSYRTMQAFLFALSCIVSTRMIYLINHGNWLVNMRQCPPLATLWTYTIVQLDLGLAVLNLVTTGVFVWWKGLKLKL